MTYKKSYMKCKTLEELIKVRKEYKDSLLEIAQEKQNNEDVLRLFGLI